MKASQSCSLERGREAFLIRGDEKYDIAFLGIMFDDFDDVAGFSRTECDWTCDRC